MNALELALYKTRKTALEASIEIGHNDISLGDITLEQCASCNIWLKPTQLQKDLDGLPICRECYTFYGP